MNWKGIFLGISGDASSRGLELFDGPGERAFHTRSIINAFTNSFYGTRLSR